MFINGDNDEIFTGIILGITLSDYHGADHGGYRSYYPKALELGETEGAMSGLAIGIAGLLTVLLAPIFIRWLG